MENRKSEIISFAKSLIQQKGYAAFSYDDISKHFGITKASIHYHFEKKEDLGLAVLNRLHLRLTEFSASIATSRESLEKKLDRFYRLQSEKFAANEICPVSALQTDFELLPERMRVKMQEISRLELTVMQDMITDEASGREADSRAMALVVLAAIKGSLQYGRVINEDMLPEVMSGICQSIIRR
ncbi:TetR/AcrR family transcriptional regulator [Paenibacillus glycinis]|uniref:TetR family transcriptional regulator n=1 Tax=Paenibacillus glycinis TaxID=2697035 RepID=A0ABW9XKA5_9BACL|nr:TetR/AcrR family transcriptional regulator [Paenibacillus glycinis]NBD22986.1 TetR family transcriptional regulator [Paenibacillus glycinis]